MVARIEAALAVCGHRSQNWDTDSSARFMDDLMHAWDATHVPDQVVSDNGPRELVSDIFAALDNLKRKLESIHGGNIRPLMEKELVSFTLWVQFTWLTCFLTFLLPRNSPRPA